MFVCRHLSFRSCTFEFHVHNMAGTPFGDLYDEVEKKGGSSLSLHPQGVRLSHARPSCPWL